MASEMTDEARQRAEAWVKQHFATHEKEWRAYYAEVTAGANVGLPRGMYTRLTDALIADRDREYRRGLEALVNSRADFHGAYQTHGDEATRAFHLGMDEVFDHIQDELDRLAQEARR